MSALRDIKPENSPTVEKHAGVTLEVRRVEDPARLRRLVRLLADLDASETLDEERER